MTPTPEEVAVGHRMYELRNAARYSRARLAAAMRDKGMPYHPETVRRIEAGTRPVRLTEIEPLAECLGVSVWVLLGREEKPPAVLLALSVRELYRIREVVDVALTHKMGVAS